jgi:hypothetical protein
MKPIRIEEGKFIWWKGDPADWILFIVKGEVFLMCTNVF